MKPILAVALAPLLLASALGAQDPPPRDTLRFPAAGDTLARPGPLPPADTTGFDSPQTAALVERVRRAGSAVPAGLEDYAARMRTSIHLSVRADTSVAGELPVTIDEFTGDVRWSRGGLVQRLKGHRVRQLAPAPYTLGTMISAPWVVPHLYGSTIEIFQLTSTGGRRGVSSAVHPFSTRGPQYYHYAAGDTVRVRTREGLTTLVPVHVRPRLDPPAGTLRQVAGTFYVDVDRAAIARARFGFVERGGGLLVTETGVFFELDNGLVEGSYWLPVRQRRELQISSPIFGGAAAVRMVTALSGYRLNAGWRADSTGARLVREMGRGDSIWEGYRDPATEGEAGTQIGDFADLREAVRPPRPGASPTRIRLGYERGSHLFRYNRVEGAFVGAGLRVEPRDPARRSWDLYGTVGYATAEGAVRGEGHARYHPVPRVRGAPQYTVGMGGYRRLRDTRAFRPAFEWELGYALGAALGGVDERDYFDAAGGELYLTRRRGPWTARVTARHERQDSVRVNTQSYLLGDADRFPGLAAVEPGDHSAVEGELRFIRGAGAFGLSNSTLASLTAEAGFGDFATRRVIGSVALRRTGTYLTVAARADAGTIAGAAAPQQLFRFGGSEGLRGYDDREFAGSSAALLRGRVLLHLPPYGHRPLARAGLLIIPPLRPAVVLSGDIGWSEISDESAPALARIPGRITDGERYSYGAGLSFFEDAVSVEHVWPGDGGEGKWYIGLTRWF